MAVKTQLVDPLGSNIGGIPTPTITNTVVTNPITTPAVAPVNPVATVAPTPVQPYIAPKLQAKIDAKKLPEYQLPESVT